MSWHIHNMPNMNRQETRKTHIHDDLKFFGIFRLIIMCMCVPAYSFLFLQIITHNLSNTMKICVYVYCIHNEEKEEKKFVFKLIHTQNAEKTHICIYTHIKRCMNTHIQTHLFRVLRKL